MGTLFTWPFPFAVGMAPPLVFYALLNSNIKACVNHRTKIRDAAIGDRCCATCLYDLAHVPVQADGCTVCPECGSAWRLAFNG